MNTNSIFIISENLPPRIREGLFARAKELLEELEVSGTLTSSQSDDLYQFLECPDVQGVAEQSGDNLMGRLENRKLKIEDYPIEFLLAWRPEAKDPIIAEIRWLTSWVLLSYIGLVLRAQKPSSIDKAAIRIRHIQDASMKWLHDFLPEPETSLEDIICHLRLLEEEYEHSPENEAVRVSELRILLQQYHEASFSLQSPKNSASQKQLEANKFFFDEETGESVEYLPEDHSNIYEYDDEEEQVADQPKSEFTAKISLVPSSQFDHALAAVKHQTKAQFLHIIRKELLLPCHPSTLHPNEAACIFSTAFNEGSKGLSLEGALICSSLLLGRHVKDILNMAWPENLNCRDETFFWINNQGILHLMHEPQLPDHKEYATSSYLNHNHVRTLRVSLPRAIGDKIIQARRMGEYNQGVLPSVNDLLEDISRRKNCPCQPQSLSTFLMSQFKRMGFDQVLAGLISGSSAKKFSAQYYSRFDQGATEEVWSQYSATLMKYVSPPDLHRETQIQIEGVGTRLSINRKKVRSVFQKLEAQIRTAVSMERRHNLYAVYVWLILAISTGHRPVEAPFDRLAFIDFIGGKAFICDKEIRTSTASRIVPLIAIVIRQLEAYCRYLERRRENLGRTSEYWATYLAKVLEFKQPFLFIIRNDRATPLRPGMVKEILENELDLPNNWYRSFLRTQLSQAKVFSQHIDALMGHENWGEEFLSANSGASWFDLSESLKKLNELVEYFQLNVVEL
jgi:hypothetical protein